MRARRSTDYGPTTKGDLVFKNRLRALAMARFLVSSHQIAGRRFGYEDVPACEGVVESRP